jgi:hypothetical protein
MQPSSAMVLTCGTLFVIKDEFATTNLQGCELFRGCSCDGTPTTYAHRFLTVRVLVHATEKVSQRMYQFFLSFPFMAVMAGFLEQLVFTCNVRTAEELCVLHVGKQ